MLKLAKYKGDCVCVVREVFKTLMLVLLYIFFVFSTSVFADAWITIGTGDIIVGGGSVLISNVSIARYGDSPGSGIIIAWAAEPAGPVDIWTRTGAFTTEASSWVKERSDVSTSTSTGQGSWTNTNQVGQGTQKYYKIMPAGSALTSADLTSEVVGKFDKVLPQGPSSSMVSTPLIPSSIDINSVIGNQLTGGTPASGDKISYWNGSGWVQTFLKSDGIWSGNLSTFDADKGYFINISADHPSKTITFVGNVTQINRTISLSQGDSLVGSSFPVNVDLSLSGLSSVLTSGAVSSADKVYYWDGTQWRQSYLQSGSTFVGSFNLFEPGCAYYIKNQALSNAPSSDIWTYLKIY